jgi:hypothetical protein
MVTPAYDKAAENRVSRETQSSRAAHRNRSFALSVH